MDDHDSGSMILKKIRDSDQPSVRAASSMFGSKLSNAPSAPRYISGNATTTAAMTVAGQLKINGKPISMNHLPIGVLLPSRSSSRKPQTVGGKTIGIVKIVSNTLRTLDLRCRQK